MSEIVVLTIHHKAGRFAVAQIHFTEGSHQDIYIHEKGGAGSIEFPSAFAPLDLRDRNNVPTMLAFLKLDTED